MQSRSYHSMVPCSTSPSVSTTATGVRACICLTKYTSSACVCSGGVGFFRGWAAGAKDSLPPPAPTGGRISFRFKVLLLGRLCQALRMSPSCRLRPFGSSQPRVPTCLRPRTPPGDAGGHLQLAMEVPAHSGSQTVEAVNDLGHPFAIDLPAEALETGLQIGVAHIPPCESAGIPQQVCSRTIEQLKDVFKLAGVWLDQAFDLRESFTQSTASRPFEHAHDCFTQGQPPGQVQPQGEPGAAMR